MDLYCLRREHEHRVVSFPVSSATSRDVSCLTACIANRISIVTRLPAYYLIWRTLRALRALLIMIGVAVVLVSRVILLLQNALIRFTFEPTSMKSLGASAPVR
jgi:hypothetical protein